MSTVASLLGWLVSIALFLALLGLWAAVLGILATVFKLGWWLGLIDK